MINRLKEVVPEADVRVFTMNPQRPDLTKLDNILGDGYNNGTNILGKCLVKLRSYYLTKN